MSLTASSWCFVVSGRRAPKHWNKLIHTISQRMDAYLERDIKNSNLQLEVPEESAINDLLGHSVTYRVAVSPQAGF